MKTLAKIYEINCMMKAMIGLAMICSFNVIQAQEANETLTRPFQVSFVSPLGTNGLQSGQVINNVSLNIIAGYSAGVNGFELGSVTNIVNGNVAHGQIAGVANLVKGTTKGVQIAGVTNLNKSEVTGVQVAGIANVVSDDANAFQLAGVTNYTVGNASKGQIAGAVNVTNGAVGITQIAGAANIATKTVKGVQIAGFANYGHEAVQGVQIGVFNYARNLKGVQVGVINVADTVEKGIPIGVLTVVRNGYRAVELSSNETIHGLVSFKTGTDRFYNIFSAGAIIGNDNAWSVGYGIGTMLPISSKMDIAIEAQAFHINEQEEWTEGLNMLNRLNLNVSYQFFKRFSAFGGISGNVAVSDITDTEGNIVGSKHIPWYSYNEVHNGVNVKMYTGFNAGLRMTF